MASSVHHYKSDLCKSERCKSQLLRCAPLWWRCKLCESTIDLPRTATSTSSCDRQRQVASYKPCHVLTLLPPSWLGRGHRSKEWAKVLRQPNHTRDSMGSSTPCLRLGGSTAKTIVRNSTITLWIAGIQQRSRNQCRTEWQPIVHGLQRQ